MKSVWNKVPLFKAAVWCTIAACTASAPLQAQIKSPPLGGHWRQKQFIITFWSPPPATDEALARVAAEGFTMTWVPVEGLDVAARHHLRAMLTSDLLRREALNDPARRAQLASLIERVKNHQALEAYFITDEPGAGAFEGLGKLVAFLRDQDPAHLAYINLYPTYANAQQLGVSADAADRARVGYPQNYAGVGADDKTVLRYREHLKKFVETVKPDLLSYDHYHFLKEDAQGKPQDGAQYFLNLALIRLASMESGIPFLNVIQADTIEKSWRLPNAEETRWLAFTTMAYGGRGISYFTYWGPADYNGLYVDGKPAARLAAIARLNKEISNFGQALLGLDSVGVYHTDPLPYGAQAMPNDCPVRFSGGGTFVLGLFAAGGRTNAFMLVNRDYRQNAEAAVQVRLPGSRLEELDRTTGAWTNFTRLRGDRKVAIKLAPGDGRLFRAK